MVFGVSPLELATRIVEEDYGTALRKPVRHKRIPIVQAAAEVLKEDERRSAFRAEAPVCVADSISLDEAGWSRDVSVFRHIYLLGYRSECYVCNYGIQTQRTRLSNSEVDAVDRFTAPGGRDIPRLRVQCGRLPPRGRHLAKRYSRRSFRRSCAS